MVNNVSNLVEADKVCDYIPVVSSVSNLVDLFIKSFVIPFKSSNAIQNSHYYTHLKEKSFLRCFILLIPVIGNIIIGIYDFANRKYDDKEYMLRAIEGDCSLTKYASLRLRDDNEFMLAVAQTNHYMLVYASEGLKNRRDFITKVAEINSWDNALEYLGEDLKKDLSFFRDILPNDGHLIRFAHPSIQNNDELMKLACQSNPDAYIYFSPENKKKFQPPKKQLSSCNN